VCVCTNGTDNLKCDHVCRNRRCLDPLLPSNISTGVNSLPADDSCLHNHVESCSTEGACKDHSDGSTSRQAVVECIDKSTSVSSESDLRASVQQTTASTYRRRSQKFTEATTWSRLHQQKTTALKVAVIPVYITFIFY